MKVTLIAAAAPVLICPRLPSACERLSSGTISDVNDTDEIDKKVTEFYEGLTDDDKKRMELDEEKIRRVYEETAIAKEVEDKILELQTENGLPPIQLFK